MLFHPQSRLEREQSESPSLIKVYLGIDQRAAMVFSGLVVVVLVAVTAIYVGIFGFDKWKTDMGRAGSMMIINYPVPSSAPPAAIPAAAPALGAAGQYVCPQCGAVGLPVFSPTGAPLCPSCGRVMRR